MNHCLNPKFRSRLDDFGHKTMVLGRGGGGVGGPVLLGLINRTSVSWDLSMNIW